MDNSIVRLDQIKFDTPDIGGIIPFDSVKFDASRSNLPPFDMKLPEGVIPEEMAKEIVAGRVVPADSIKLDSPEESRGFLAGLAHTGRAIAETGAGITTGMAAFPISLGTGAIEYVLTGGDKEKAIVAQNKAAQRIQFEPTTPEARDVMGRIGTVINPIFDTFKQMGESSPAGYLGGVAAQVGGAWLMGKAGQTVKGEVVPVVDAVKAKFQSLDQLREALTNKAVETPPVRMEPSPPEVMKIVPVDSIKLDEVAPKIETAIAPPPPEIVQPRATSGGKQLDILEGAEAGVKEPIRPEGTESRLAIRAEADAIAAKLTSDFGDLVEYKTMNMADQATRAAEVMAVDYGKAKRMAMGEELPPPGIREATMYEAVKIRAIKEGDVDTLQKLATESTVPTRLSEYGQAIKAADSRLMDDPVKAMQDIGKTREATAARITGAKAPPPAEVTKLKQAVDVAKAAADEHLVKKAIDNLIKPETTAETPKVKYGSRNKIVTTIEYEMVRAELRELFGTQLSAGIDPTIAVKLGKIGTYHFEAGIRNFELWSHAIIKDVGEWARPHLEDLWKATQGTFHKATKDEFTKKISKAMEDGSDMPDIGRQAQALAKQFISEGIKERDPLVMAVHDVLKDIIPEITPRETADAISGYGKYKQLSKDEIDIQLRDIKGQLQQVSKLEDLQSKGTAEKTGVERRTPSDEERRLIKLVEEAKRKYGIQTIDSATQLKSSLDAIKTRLKNSISDITTEIESGERLSRSKGVPYDTEATALKKQRDALVVLRDALVEEPKEFTVEKPGEIPVKKSHQLTQEQRINSAIRAAERTAGSYAREALGQGKEKLVSVLETPELVNARNIANEWKERVKELRQLSGRSPEQSLKSLKTRLINETRKLSDKLDNLDFAKPEKRKTVLDLEALKLQVERDRAKKNYRAATEAAGTVTREEAVKIVEYSKVAADAKQNFNEVTQEWSTPKDKADYGAARVVYLKYIDSLKNPHLTLMEMIRNRAGEAKVTFKDNRVKAATDLTKDAITAISDMSISFVASIDNSFLGRQGLNTLLTHPTIWASAAKKSFADIYNTMASKHGGELAKDALKADVYSRPNYMNGSYDIAKLIPRTEEQFPTSIPERMPLGAGRAFKASENAFVNSAIRMRINTFDLMQDIARKNGVDVTDKIQIQEMGKLINSVTARGDLGRLGEGGLIRLVLWAPKMLKGNWDVLTAHTGGAGLATPFARQQARINLLKIVASTATVAAVANALNPGSVETDPRSSDFLKIRVGNTRYDITGGKGSIISLLARAITFSTKSAETGKVTPLNSGKYGAKTVFDVGIDFLVNKTTPAARTAINVAKGRDFQGQKPTAGNVVYGLTTPISIQNFVKNFYGPDADGSVAAVVGSIVDIVGINANTYAQKHKLTPLK